MPNEIEKTLEEIENAPNVEPVKIEQQPEQKSEQKVEPTDEEQLQALLMKRPDLYQALVEGVTPKTEPPRDEDEDEYAKGVVSKAVREVQERSRVERGIVRQVREAMAGEDVDIPEAYFSQLEDVVASPDYDLASLKKALNSRVFVTNAKGVLHDLIKKGDIKPKAKPEPEKITPTVNKTKASNLTAEQADGTRRFAAALGLNYDELVEQVSK